MPTHEEEEREDEGDAADEAADPEALQRARLEEAWQRHTFDSSWTREMRDYLDGSLADVDVAASVDRVDCRTTMCRLELTLDHPGAGAQLLELIADPNAPRLTFTRMQGSAIAVTAYVLRDGAGSATLEDYLDAP